MVWLLVIIVLLPGTTGAARQYRALKDFACSVCLAVLKPLEEMKERVFSSAVEASISTACSAFPDFLTQSCTKMVKEHSSDIRDQVNRGVGSRPVCEFVGLCKPGEPIPPKEAATAYNFYETRPDKVLVPMKPKNSNLGKEIEIQ